MTVVVGRLRDESCRRVNRIVRGIGDQALDLRFGTTTLLERCDKSMIVMEGVELIISYAIKLCLLDAHALSSKLELSAGGQQDLDIDPRSQIVDKKDY
jgi:hypothetical protein